MMGAREKPRAGIRAFRGEHSFLSNFYTFPFVWRGKVWPSAEHAFQAAKCADEAAAERIRLNPSPTEAKRLGRKARLRENWDGMRIGIMRELLKAKFEAPGMREKLLATGNAELVENNHWGDTYWGVCQGQGENHLGRALMQVRESLRAEAAASRADTTSHEENSAKRAPGAPAF